jgi:hypothetical protein
MSNQNILEPFRAKMRDLIVEHELNDAAVTVSAKSLTPQEAIGTPQRRDYPILEGKERVIEASVLGARGQAFTDAPSDFTGRLRDVLEMPLMTNRARAVFIAAMNASLSYMNLVEGTLHCKNEEPEKCAAEIAAAARRLKVRTIGLIGFNPAIADALVREFGPDNIGITDLNPANIGTSKYSVPLWNGRTQIALLIHSSQLILATGTTLINGTFDEIRRLAETGGKRLIVYGITGAGVCGLMNLKRWCFQAQNGRGEK